MSNMVLNPTEISSETTSLISSRSDTDIPETRPLNDQDVTTNILTPDADWRSELNLVIKYSVPLILTYLLQYSSQLTTVIAVSRLTTLELAGLSLGISTTNIAGFAIFEGMATSLDTLCSQAYGSGHPRLVGLHVLRFIIMIHLVVIPIGVLWMFSPYILAYLIPQKDVALLAGSFLRISVLSLPGYALFEAGKRFMQAQGNFTASLAVILVCAPTNIFLTWLLAFPLHMGLQGAALAGAITHTLRPFLLLLYTRFIAPETLQCWPTSRDIRQHLFDNWSPMISLSIPGALMTLCEWFAFEILAFSTSYLGTADMAAQTLLSTSSVLIWHIPFSASVAICTRIGQLIGAGAVDVARSVTRLYAVGFAILGIFDAGFLVVLNKIITRDLATDGDVVRLVGSAMPFMAIFQFFDTSVCWIHGVVRGLGWQSVGGWTTFVVNYLYAVPLALYLELGPPKLGINGIWISIASGLAAITIIETSVVGWRDWERAAREAKEREL